jgi:putative GTP pyrophosphokinase
MIEIEKTEYDRERELERIEVLVDKKQQMNYKEFAEMQQIYSAAIKEIKTKIEILDDEFQIKYDHDPIHHIESRLKSPQSIMEKLNKHGCEINAQSIREYVTDFAGIRIICNYVGDIDMIADLILKQSDITLIRRKDYVKNPKENGYRSLHLVVGVPIFLAERTVETPVEIQIRTIAMNFWASLEHKIRYKSGNVPEEVAARLKKCADDIDKVDNEMQAIYLATKSGASDGIQIGGE